MDTSEILKSDDPDKINEFIIESLLRAANKAIPIKTNNQNSCIRLQKYLMNLINKRRSI